MLKLLRLNHFARWLKGIMIKHMHNMISCREFEAFILDYLESQLSTAQKLTFEKHMRICSECREYLAAYKRSIELGQAVFSDLNAAVPDDVPEDLVKAILESQKQ
jgi:anti-sigma factor RsiW